MIKSSHYNNNISNGSSLIVRVRYVYVHQMTIIRTQIMGSYYFFFENFLQQNYTYKFKEFIKNSYR